jgi:hypothetical protein
MSSRRGVSTGSMCTRRIAWPAHMPKLYLSPCSGQD